MAWPQASKRSGQVVPDRAGIKESQEHGGVGYIVGNELGAKVCNSHRHKRRDKDSHGQEIDGQRIKPEQNNEGNAGKKLDKRILPVYAAAAGRASPFEQQIGDERQPLPQLERNETVRALRRRMQDRNAGQRSQCQNIEEAP